MEYKEIPDAIGSIKVDKMNSALNKMHHPLFVNNGNCKKEALIISVL